MEQHFSSQKIELQKKQNFLVIVWKNLSGKKWPNVFHHSTSTACNMTLLYYLRLFSYFYYNKIIDQTKIGGGDSEPKDLNEWKKMVKIFFIQALLSRKTKPTPAITRSRCGKDCKIKNQSNRGSNNQNDN